MKTPQILTGQQAIEQFGLNKLIECRVAVTTELNGLDHSVMQIGVIADPDSCQIDEDDTGVLWVEYQGADDWYLYSIPADEQFVLLDDKTPPASNEVLARRVVELTAERDAALSASKYSADVCEQALAARKELAAQVEKLRNLLQQFDPAVFEYNENDFDLGDEVIDALEATPAQCLAEVRAQAVEDGYKAGALRYGGNLYIVIDEAGEYANQLRQQAKGGA